MVSGSGSTFRLEPRVLRTVTPGHKFPSAFTWSYPVHSTRAPHMETTFVFNTFSFLVLGALVMWMCAGFTALEAGSVKTKNAAVICLKNIGLYSIAGIAYFVLGYNLMYGANDFLPGFLGDIRLGYGPSEAERMLGSDEGAVADVASQGASQLSNWFFQMVFVATTASIVSGALAERVKLWSFFVFTAVLTTVIYPIIGSWTWGGGWLAGLGSGEFFETGFSDFAGSTIVHSTGGWAALAGVMVVGARHVKFRKDGSVRVTPPSNIPLVTLGVFILWLGWFGFNGGSMLALGSVQDAVGMSNVIVATNLAAAAGVLTAILVSRPILGRLDLFAVLNGAIAGLVSITAAPDLPDQTWAILIGAIGATICTAGLKLLEILKLDDVVGAIPAHLMAGVWGTIAAAIWGGADFLAQVIGILSIGAFVFATSFAVWKILDLTMGVRVSRQAEQIGQDAAELGIDAYPEFVIMADPEEFDDEGDD